jgi:hypothetical protein
MTSVKAIFNRFLGTSSLVDIGDGHKHSGWEVTCCRCGATTTVIFNKANVMPPEAVVKKFAQKGWTVGKRPADDVCPDCLNARPHAVVTAPALDTTNGYPSTDHQPIFDVDRFIDRIGKYCRSPVSTPDRLRVMLIMLDTLEADVGLYFLLLGEEGMTEVGKRFQSLVITASAAGISLNDLPPPKSELLSWLEGLDGDKP